MMKDVTNSRAALRTASDCARAAFENLECVIYTHVVCTAPNLSWFESPKLSASWYIVTINIQCTGTAPSLSEPTRHARSSWPRNSSSRSRSRPRSLSWSSRSQQLHKFLYCTGKNAFFWLKLSQIKLNIKMECGNVWPRQPSPDQSVTNIFEYSNIRIYWSRIYIRTFVRIKFSFTNIFGHSFVSNLFVRIYSDIRWWVC